MHQAMTRLARAMAVLGALVLVFLILMVCASVLGRELNSFLNSDAVQAAVPGLAATLLGWGVGPITGDFELLEHLMPLAIFAFLPLAQLGSSHATVDVFTTRLPRRLLVWMRAVTETVFAVVLVIFAVKLFEGTQAKMRFGETTYLIQFPVWWAYAAAFGASAIAALTGIYMAGVRLVEAATGAEIAEDDAEPEH